MFPKLPRSLRFPELPENYDPRTPWATDLEPEREKLAEALYNYLKQQKEQTGVIALHAGWGMGKSLFLRMWQDSLLNDGHPCFYFNAWKYDYTQSAITSFLVALERQAEELTYRLSENSDEAREPARTGLKEKFVATKSAVEDMYLYAWSFGVNAISRALPDAVRGISTAGLIAQGCDPTIAQTAGHFTKACVEEHLVPHSKEDKKNAFRQSVEAIRDMERFQEQMAQYAKDIAGDEPLIILVDELDRCRPDFAISLLEEIKHLFSVPGVFFVLAVEKDQLSNCISARYGLTESGAMLYLDKFIDITFNLPVPDYDTFLTSLNNYVRIPSTKGYANSVLGIIKEFCPDIGLRGLVHAMSKLGFVNAQEPTQPETMAATVLLLLMHNKSLDAALAQLREFGDSYLSRTTGELILGQNEFPKQMIYATCRFFWPDSYRPEVKGIGIFDYAPQEGWKQFDGDQFRERVCRLLHLTGNARVVRL